MFKKIFKWFLSIHVVLATWGLLLSIIYLNSQGGSESDSSSKYAIYKIIGFCLLGFCIITPLIHLIYYVYCVILKTKKRFVNFSLITITYLSGVTAFFLWLSITIKLNDNGIYDLIWRPDDTGLWFLSLSSLFMHYFLLSNFIFDRIVPVFVMFYELIVQLAWIVVVVLIFHASYFYERRATEPEPITRVPLPEPEAFCDDFQYETQIDSSAQIIQPYCKLLLSEKFYDLLGSERVVSKEQLKSAIKNTSTEELVVGVFVGGGKRVVTENSPRSVSNDPPYIQNFYPDYYYYAFQNYSNMFIMTNPDVPQKVFNYKVDGDELIASYCYNDIDKVAKQLRLKPTNDSLLINNVYCKIWIKNDSQRFIDVSFLKDSIKTDNFNINHQYFQEVSERFVQLKCGKRDEMYTTDYDIVL